MASINVNDILSKPYAYSFANSSTCEIQSKDLEKSVKTAAKTPLDLYFFKFSPSCTTDDTVYYSFCQSHTEILMKYHENMHLFH